eukprot:gnl/Spiro4/12494_TR6602_c0_g1_i1.p1 gnl/Spiro4/12494_TR6602_c0_g1~~gnl/Spiro4/12494_TR6602_c0_g1_i1.p1  ORF type:complete len:525 (+),score=74.67 gnl/Spiro4/12494_TR6602_c0_g1_i1:111-1685(+)
MLLRSVCSTCALSFRRFFLLSVRNLCSRHSEVVQDNDAFVLARIRSCVLFESALKAFQARCLRKEPPSELLFREMILLCARHRQPVIAHTLFKEVREIHPNTSPETCAAFLCATPAKTEEFLGLLSTPATLGTAMNMMTPDLLYYYFNRAPESVRSKSLLLMLESSGFEPTVLALNSLVARSHSTEPIEPILEMMERAGLWPNHVTNVFRLRLLLRSHNWPDAVALFESFFEHLPPTTASTTTAPTTISSSSTPSPAPASPLGKPLHSTTNVPVPALTAIFVSLNEVLNMSLSPQNRPTQYPLAVAARVLAGHHQNPAALTLLLAATLLHDDLAGSENYGLRLSLFRRLELAREHADRSVGITPQFVERGGSVFLARDRPLPPSVRQVLEHFLANPPPHSWVGSLQVAAIVLGVVVEADPELATRLWNYLATQLTQSDARYLRHVTRYYGISTEDALQRVVQQWALPNVVTTAELAADETLTTPFHPSNPQSKFVKVDNVSRVIRDSNWVDRLYRERCKLESSV